MAQPTKPASGQLIVAITEDCQNVVVNHPDLQPDAEGCGHIVFSPDEAVHLALLLWRKASVIRGIACGHCGEPVNQQTGWATAQFRYCFKEECQQEFYKEAQAMIRKVDPETAELLAAATKLNGPTTKLNGPTTCDHAEGKAWVSQRDGIEVCALCYLSRKEKRFTCPKCGAVSHNPNDAAQRYCGACHSFFGELEIGLRG